MSGVLLKVTYQSQKDKATAAYSFNDCGPCCLAMMIMTIGQQVTTDGIYRRAGIANKGPLLVSTVRNAGNLYGLGLEYHDLSRNMSLDRLKTFLNDGRPALVLIDYAPIMRAKFHESAINGGHFVNVVGYDEDEDVVIVHDPYWNGQGGANRRWKSSVFEASWFARGTQYQKVALVPAKGIAQAISGGSAYPMPADINRRMRARALFEGIAFPKITNDSEYQAALKWLGTWGTESRDYTIIVGDSLGLVATRYFGSPQYYTAIAAYNGISDPDTIKVGQVIKVPIPSADSTGGSTAKKYTNQEIINAFSDAFKERGLPDQYWNGAVSAGLESIAANRNAIYTGPDIDKLPALSAELKALIYKHLTN